MIIGNNKEVKKIYKDNEAIIDIKKGTLPIYSRGSIMESLLTLPAKITAVTKKIKDLKLYGNTEQEPLIPSEYQQVEYIQSSGTQYIDTGFKPNNNSRMVTKVNLVQQVGDYDNIGGARDDGNNQFHIVINYASPSSFDIRYGTQSRYYNTTITGLHTIDFNKTSCTIDSATQIFNYATFQSSYNAYVFAVNNAGTATQLSNYKLYYLKWYDNGTLVRDYIPCYRKSDNVIGLYDLVNKTFSTNAGTGTFTKGNNVGPSPDYPSSINTITGRQEIQITDENLFDGNWYNGSINGQTGAEFDSSTRLRTLNYIEIDNSKTYNITTNDTSIYSLFIFEYNSSKTYIQRVPSDWIGSYVFTPTANTKYIKVLVKYNDNSTITTDANVGLKIVNKLNNYEINLGKNLFNLTNLGSNLGIDFNLSSSELLLDGTTTSNGNIINDNTIKFSIKKGNYTISSSILSGTYTAGSRDIAIYVRKVSDSSSLLTMTKSDNYTKSASIQLDSDEELYVQIYTNGEGFAFNNFKLGFQIEKGSVASSYSAYKTPMELCKINDYKDYIYKSNGTWYKHKVIGKFILNGTEDWNNDGGTIGTDYRHNIQVSKLNIGTPINTNYLYKSNYFYAINIGRNNVELGGFYLSSSWLVFDDKNATISSTNNWKNWLSNNNVSVYYVLATPVEEEITDTELISQLNAIELVNGDNYINSSSTYLQISQIFIKYRGE